MLLLSLLSFLLLPFALTQPKCSSSGIPQQLPLLQTQHLLLDLNNYFIGPNLTIELSSDSPIVTLDQKYQVKESVHLEGTVLSVSSNQQIVTMLGVTHNFRYYLAYAKHPHLQQHHQNGYTILYLPDSLKKCTNHALSLLSNKVAATCQHISTNKYILAHTILPQSQQPVQWTLLQSSPLVQLVSQTKMQRQVQFLNNDRVAVVIPHPTNSYIQLWNLLYNRQVGVFDRYSLHLQVLQIVDMQMYDGYLYILDYQTGVYQLKMVLDGFVLKSVGNFYYYTKLAVCARSLAITKRGSVAQFHDNTMFKYQAFGTQTIKEVIISSEYIVVYTEVQVIVYLRGQHTPYWVYSSFNQHIVGTFINDTHILQSMQSGQATALIQDIQLSHPYLRVPGLAPSKSKIKLTALSKIYQQTQKCSIQFQLVRTKQQQMQIFQNVYNRNGTQNIFMNRPGKAQIDLSPYGMGPDLNYKIQTFAQTVNLSTSIKKVSTIPSVYIQNIQNMQIKNTYFSDECGLYKDNCPLAIDSVNDKMMKYYSCRIDVDYYDQVTKSVNCTQKYKQYKTDEYLHYDIEQVSTNNAHFYQISVYQNTQNVINVRKFDADSDKYRPTLSTKVKIDGNNVYGQDNVTVLDIDTSSGYLYCLLKMRKQIQIFKIQQISQSQSIKITKIMSITASSLNNIYFAPQLFKIDSNGMLWVKSYYDILVVDVGKVESQGTVRVLKQIQIQVSGIDIGFQFEVVQQLPTSSLFINRNNNNSTINDSNVDDSNVVDDQTFLSGGSQNKMPIRHLIIYSTGQRILTCSISHLYQIDQYQLQPLPIYSYTMFLDSKLRKVQSLGNSQLFVSLYDISSNMKINAIYDLQYLTLVQAYYTGIPSKLSTIPAYFHMSTSNPVIVFVQTNKVSSTSAVSGVQIDKIPKMSLSVSSMLGETNSQQMLIRVYNDKSSIRYSLVLGIANSPENLTRGRNYPYDSITHQVEQKYIEIDTRGWVQGNVLATSYACPDCYTINNNQSRPYVDVKGKVWQKQSIQIVGGKDFQTVKNNNDDNNNNDGVGIINWNTIYLVNAQTSSIQAMYQITQNPTDTILKYIIDLQQSLITAVYRSSQSQQLYLTTYSTSTFKGFILNTIRLRSTIQYVMNLQYRDGVIVLLDFTNIYIYSVNRNGVLYLVEEFNQVEAGGAVCWMELLNNNQKQTITTTQQQQTTYTLIVTLCSQGITYINFILQQNMSVLKVTNKQSMDLIANLNTYNIRMPADSTFRRTLTYYMNINTLSVLISVYNFDNLQYTFYLKNNTIVSSIRLNKIIHRYGDFASTQQISLDPQKRYGVVTYYGLYQKQYQYIHALYDMGDVHNQGEQIGNVYIMQIFTSQVNRRPQFVKNGILLVLSTNSLLLQKRDIANKLRIVIHNPMQMYSQSLIIIPNTPVSSLIIQMELKGIDLVVWQFWQIALIAIGGIVFIGVVGLAVKTFYGKYQQNKKLVPLLRDYQEYQEDLKEERGRRDSNGKDSLRTSMESDISQALGKRNGVQVQEERASAAF